MKKVGVSLKHSVYVQEIDSDKMYPFDGQYSIYVSKFTSVTDVELSCKAHNLLNLITYIKSADQNIKLGKTANIKSLLSMNFS